MELIDKDKLLKYIIIEYGKLQTNEWNDNTVNHSRGIKKGFGIVIKLLRDYKEEK